MISATDIGKRVRVRFLEGADNVLAGKVGTLTRQSMYAGLPTPNWIVNIDGVECWFRPFELERVGP